MNMLPEIHLCIVQPLGYVHSLGLLDQARYFRWQFRRLGAKVSMAKNRLRDGAVNFVFGAHLGFDAAQTRRQTCLFVNLEQLGAGGAQVSPEYLKLLAASAVVDYDADNVASYARDAGDVPLVPFLYAPYLAPAEPMPLEDRPIDLLFFGSMNPRRKALIQKIESLGRSVSVFDAPLYGPERDVYIAQAKAVLNLHFYESSRFEQARVSHCLSLGTPVISERTPRTRPHEAFEDCVLWLHDDAELVQFFTHDVGTPECHEAMRAGLARFAESDPLEAYADLLAFAAGYAGELARTRVTGPWRPERLKLGGGVDHRSGWLNISLRERDQPDLLLDLSAPLALPLQFRSHSLGEVLLEESGVSVIHAAGGFEQVGDLSALMENCLRLLETGGQMQADLPCIEGRALMAPWSGTTCSAAAPWAPCIDHFWELGWFDHRFTLVESLWLDEQGRPCERQRAAWHRSILRKVETSARERMEARTALSDFGGVPEDWREAPEVGVDAIRLVPIEVPARSEVFPPAARVAA